MAQAGEGEANDADAWLKSLSVSRGDLVPAFTAKRPQIMAVQLPHGIESIEITVTANDPRGVIRVNGEVMTGGKVSAPVAVGRTLIPVQVTAADGTTQQTYTIKTLREQPMANWRQVLRQAPWPGRDSAGELVFNDRMWILGGYIPKVIGDVWSSPDGVEWTYMGEVPTEAGINIPVNFVHQGRMWVASNKGEWFASSDGVRWDLVNAAPPCGGRYASGGTVFRDRMWVMGGQKGRQLFNDVWSSSDGVAWTQVTESAPWSPRQLFGNVVTKDDRLFVIGGGITKYEPFRAYRDVWSSSDGRQWEQLTDQAPWPARIWSTCIIYRNRIFLLGGFRAQPKWENLGDVWYSADGRTWKQLLTETIWSTRHELSAYVFQDKLWVIAGNTWPLLNDVWSLEIPGLIFLTQPVIEEYAGALYRYRAEADFHLSAGPLRYRLIEAPPWLTVDESTGVVSGIPAATGDFNITLEAADGAGESARQSWALHVQAM